MKLYYRVTFQVSPTFLPTLARDRDGITRQSKRENITNLPRYFIRAKTLELLYTLALRSKVQVLG